MLRRFSLTGSSGFVGSSLQRSLVDWQVVSVGRGDPIPSGDSSQPAIVVHAAWPAGDTASWAPFRDWSLRLGTSAAERGAWFVGLGSGLEAHAAHPGLKEPYSSYALRKLELRERLVEMDPERFAWIRLHFMFGPGERPCRIIPSAIRAALKGEESGLRLARPEAALAARRRPGPLPRKVSGSAAIGRV